MSRGISTNSAQVAAKYRRRAEVLGSSVRKWLRQAAKTTNQVALDYIRGGGPPGDYPVPVRRNNAQEYLLGNQDFQANGHMAVVFNSSDHAVAVHEGKGSSRPHGRRPFLDDAVRDVQPTRMVQEGVSRDVMAIG